MRMKNSIVGIGLCVMSLTFAGTQMAAAQGVKQETKEAVAKTGNAITDGWITMKIHAQFVPEKALENSDINVDTKANVVTLRGSVMSEAGRTRATTLAKQTEGVTRVIDELRIGPKAKS